MSYFSNDLADLFRRDLATLVREVEAFPSDEMLWQTARGINNAAGNLVLHLEGNLREYIGRQLGGIEYVRDRPLEFSSRGISRRELAERIAELIAAIPPVIASLSVQQMESPFPEVVLERALSTHAFLIHLLAHLNWHMGQLDYLRRVLTGEGAIQRAKL